MAVSRRGFLQTTAGLAGGLASGVRPTWADPELPPSTAQPSTIRVLGMRPEQRYEKMAHNLSDDVFQRVCQAITRPCRLLDATRIGEINVRHSGSDGVDILRHKATTAVRVGTPYMTNNPPVFDLAAFRRATNHWDDGLMLLRDKMWTAGADTEAMIGPDNIAETFGAAQLMGQPFLPHGVDWRAHYVDERTGAFMRVVLSYEIGLDEFVVRWDVVYG